MNTDAQLTLLAPVSVVGASPPEGDEHAPSAALAPLRGVLGDSFRAALLVSLEQNSVHRADRAEFSALLRESLPDLGASEIEVIERALRDRAVESGVAEQVRARFVERLREELGGAAPVLSLVLAGNGAAGREVALAGALLNSAAVDGVVLVGASEAGATWLGMAHADRVAAHDELARIEAMRSCAEPDQEPPGSVLPDALRDAGIAPGQLEHLTLCGPDVTGLTALAEVLPDTSKKAASCVLGALRACGVTALGELVRNLHFAELPATPAELVESVGESGVLGGSALCLTAAPQPWWRQARGSKRWSVLSRVGCAGGAEEHLVLSGSRTIGESVAVNWLAAGGPVLLSLSAADGQGLADKAAERIRQLRAGHDLVALARDAESRAHFTAVLVAHDVPGMLRELAAAERDLPGAIAEGRDWATPSGSFCTAAPVGEGKVAFVFPGTYAAYVGAGGELPRLFPGLLSRAESVVDAPAESFAAERLHLRSSSDVGPEALARHERGMRDDVGLMLSTGVNLGVVNTWLLRDVLGIRPDGALGYSLGEISMLFALDVWPPREGIQREVRESPIFQRHLHKHRSIVRQAWEIDPTVPDDSVWSTNVLLTDPSAIRELRAEFPRVFITHVNTDAEVVVAGDPEQCARLAERLGCTRIELPPGPAVHTELVDHVHDELVRLNDHPVGEPDPGLELLSAHDFAAFPLDDREAIVRRIVGISRSEIDFATLSRTAYERGYRYFVEVGPGSDCARWVSTVLGARPHVAVSIDRRGLADAAALARALARLVSAGLDIDLARLFGAERSGSDESAPFPGWESDDQGAGPEPAAADAILLEDEVFAAPVTRTPASSGQNETRPQPTPVPQPPPVPQPTPGSQPPPVPQPTPGSELVPSARNAVRLNGAGGPLVALGSTVATAHKTVMRTHTALLHRALGQLASPVPTPPGRAGLEMIRLDAAPGVWERSTATVDVKVDAWYGYEQVPMAALLEGRHGVLPILDRLGADPDGSVRSAYRFLGGSVDFHDRLPAPSAPLRFEIWVDEFVWDGDDLRFAFGFSCWCGTELVLELHDGRAGLFTDAGLRTLSEESFTAGESRRCGVKRFKPLERTERGRLDSADLRHLAAGSIAAVFGPAWDQSADGCNPSIRLAEERLLVLSDVAEIDRLGGPRELGRISGDCSVPTGGPLSKSGFSADPVFADVLLEGSAQLLRVYAMYLGLHLVFPDAQFQPARGWRTEVELREQLAAGESTMRLVAEITEITMLDRPTVVADVLLYADARLIGRIRDCAVEIREKPGTAYRLESGRTPVFLGRRNARGEPALLNEFHIGHMEKGDPTISMGTGFEIYSGRKALYIPNGDFRFVDRIMEINGEPGNVRQGGSMIAEYDSPPDAWYYTENTAAEMPNCALMEASLQAAAAMGCCLGTSFIAPEVDWSIRNLDGRATLHYMPELSGRTLRQHTQLRSTQHVGNAILQRIRYQLTADDDVFYEGESLFGYFDQQAMAAQVGLDGGAYVPPWLDSRSDIDAERIAELPIADDPSWTRPQPGSGLLIGHGHLRLLDEATVVADGGRNGLGYLKGSRVIDPEDWYFDCHFYQDPVMPGSLGVEAAIQGLQIFIRHTGLADGMGPVVFASPEGVPLNWKYRGQILRADSEMTLELHVTEVRRQADRMVVLAEASVYKPGMRIYELRDLAVEVRPSGDEGGR